MNADPIFEYVVYGRPASSQPQSRRDPKPSKTYSRRRDKFIKPAVQEAWETYSKDVLIDPLRLDLVWAYDEHEADDPDIDNIVKPFIDSLEGLLYGDDHVVCEMHLFKFSLGQRPKISPPVDSDKLKEALASQNEFVFVRIAPIVGRTDV